MKFKLFTQELYRLHELEQIEEQLNRQIQAFIAEQGLKPGSYQIARQNLPLPERRLFILMATIYY